MFEMFPVVSKRISEMGYDEESATVYVRFLRDGRGWQYRNVPRDVWQQFLTSNSKGKFIQDVLDHYDHGPAQI